MNFTDTYWGLLTELIQFPTPGYVLQYVLCVYIGMYNMYVSILCIYMYIQYYASVLYIYVYAINMYTYYCLSNKFAKIKHTIFHKPFKGVLPSSLLRKILHYL